MKVFRFAGRLAAFVSMNLLFASVGLAADPACEPGKVATKYPKLAGKTIKVGADPQTPPYVFREGTDFNKVVGIDADLARAVLDCAGLKYEFVLGAWSGLLPATQAGQIDIFWDDLYYKAERAKVVDFATYMTAATGALVAAGNPKKVTSWESLCGLTASFGLGSSNEINTKKQDEACKAKGAPAINMMPFQDLASGLRLLDNGRADVIMWDLGFVDNLVQNNKAKYSRGFAIMDGFVVGAAVQKGNQELLRLINEGLLVLQKNGTQKKIFEKYGVDPALIHASEIRTQ